LHQGLAADTLQAPSSPLSVDMMRSIAKTAPQPTVPIEKFAPLPAASSSSTPAYSHSQAFPTFNAPMNTGITFPLPSSSSSNRISPPHSSRNRKIRSSAASSSGFSSGSSAPTMVKQQFSNNNASMIPPANPLNFPAGSQMDYRMAAMAAASVGSMPYSNLVAASAMIGGSRPLKTEPQTTHLLPAETAYDSDGMQMDGGGQDEYDGVTGEKLPPEKRLQRKAELARESRKKKKQYVQELEERLKQLETRVAELEAKHERSQEKRKCTVTMLTQENDRSKHQKQLIHTMSEILNQTKVNGKNNLSGAQMEILQEQVNTFMETSREVQSQLEYNLDRVEDVISPSLQIKFTLWGLDQNDDFYDTPGLWSSLLSEELGLSLEQVEKLKSFRGRMHHHRQQLKHAEILLRDLRDSCGSHLDRFNRELDKMNQILTPVQLAKFYVWIEQNEWCMQMLNSMWIV
jgi:hypothetical protein